ncbi:hypothetical protein [Haladaptatus caseinilyticus]|uniref:hypothetical protein n=1 Tax=Haladaptatus caseinilyticus TaxID=2993314 RepID=UPI00224B01AB|nr:hypothetical protein [Haladaptatus caseinilyticus]
MTGHSTDRTNDERQLRPREKKGGLEQWVEYVFFAVGEVTFLGLPAFALLMLAEPNGPLKFAAIFVWATLALITGTMRCEWHDIRWPRMTPVLVVVRLCYYNAVILTVSYFGAMADITLHSPAVTAAVAVVLSFGCALAFPRVAEFVTASVPN